MGERCPACGRKTKRMARSDGTGVVTLDLEQPVYTPILRSHNSAEAIPSGGYHFAEHRCPGRIR